MNDYELNKAIAAYVYPDEIIHMVRGKVLIHTIGTLDYCNNWNDLMPLVIAHKISLQKRLCGGWGAVSQPAKDWPIIVNKIPQRALAECLLKVLTNNKE